MIDKPTSDTPAPIFSHAIDVADVPPTGLDIAIEADAATLRALAAADGLPKIARLDAEFHVVPKPTHRFNVSGEVRAEITQICVVSLDPFDSVILEPIDVDFAPAEDAAAASAAAGTVIGDADGAQADEPPDPIIDGKIDLGALASEFFALGLDPYPRKPGVSFEQPEKLQDGTSDETPFSVLRKLKARR